MSTVPAEILALPIEERALIAFQVAVREAIEEHAREGLPMHVWRDGKVVAVPAEELLDKS
jgi:hypothetical protein